MQLGATNVDNSFAKDQADALVTRHEQVVMSQKPVTKATRAGQGRVGRVWQKGVPLETEEILSFTDLPATRQIRKRI
jgi:hypothetical protein